MLDANHLILKIIQWSFQLDMNYARYDFLFWLAQYNTFFRVCFFGPSISLSIYHLSSHLLVFASLLVFSYGAKFQEWAFFPACSMSFLYVHIFHQIEMLALVYVSRGVIGEMIGVLGGFSLLVCLPGLLNLNSCRMSGFSYDTIHSHVNSKACPLGGQSA